MAGNKDILYLSPEATGWFLYRMKHPDPDAIRKRNNFLSQTNGWGVSYDNGEINANIPDFTLKDGQEYTNKENCHG